MPTEAEELQAKEFLKRAEIRTMRKDLLRLREADSLRERDKIAQIKTIEEQRMEQQKKLEEQQILKQQQEKAKREEVLLMNENQEYQAEKDLKKYATEEEKQRIFLFESQRFGFQKQSEQIDREREPAVQLEKNKILLETQNWQKKLQDIVNQEKKLEDEQKAVASRAEATALPSEKKSLESRRWELDTEIQNVEKTRWAAEKQIEDLGQKVKDLDGQSLKNTSEKNVLRDKILGVDKSLREIYSGIIARIEEQKRGLAAEQVARREAMEKAKAEANEKVQRSQWGGKQVNPLQGPQQSKTTQLDQRKAFKEKLESSAKKEEEQRKKFLADVGQASEKNMNQPLQKSNTNIK